jgi:threonine aldolase
MVSNTVKLTCCCFQSGPRKTKRRLTSRLALRSSRAKKRLCSASPERWYLRSAPALLSLSQLTPPHQTNQLAIRTWLQQPPHSILLDSRSHIFRSEAGGVASHSQAITHAIPPSNGHHLTLGDILSNVVLGDDIHSAPTRIVALENTLSGMVFPQEEILKISEAMRDLGMVLHCDGARAWEVQAKTGLKLEELCRPFDSVSLCMSKGLGAPVGR